MTRETDILGRRRAESPAGEELRRRLLALVLAAVLVWYTVVVPSGAPARSSAARVPDDEGRDGEVRGGGVRERAGGARAYSIAGTSEGAEFGPSVGESARGPVEDLDWPEYIYPD